LSVFVDQTSWYQEELADAFMALDETGIAEDMMGGAE
jgi:hypothetical protein